MHSNSGVQPSFWQERGEEGKSDHLEKGTRKRKTFFFNLCLDGRDTTLKGKMWLGLNHPVFKFLNKPPGTVSVHREWREAHYRQLAPASHIGFLQRREDLTNKFWGERKARLI